MEIIRAFNNISKHDVDIAGGKGASLGEMAQAGMPVPEGFVILSNAFDKFIEEADLNVEIDSILDKIRYQDMGSIENASEEIKALILNAEMPKNITEDIIKSFKKLSVRFVAVRSSATSEDSSTAAWAGQLESYLNTTEKMLLENVKKCWASLFTPRAIFYRKEKNLHKNKISVAVVVQKMVDSECSGIAFSVHPVTQDENQVIIEACFGLGEAIVSGTITPDAYVIEKKPRRIIDKNIIVQEKGLYRDSKGGNEWRALPKKMGEKQEISDKEILELTEIILNIEKHYGFPCDIEWAREKGKFYIIQSRPIATLTERKEEKIIDSQLEFDINKFSKLNYHYFHNRFRTPIYTYLLWEGLTHHHNKDVSFDYEIDNMIDLDNDLAVDINEWNNLVKRINNYLERDKNLLKKLMKQALELNSEILVLVRSLNKNFKKDYTSTLKDLNSFFKKTYQFGAFNIFTLLVEKNLEEKLKEIIRIKFGEDRTDIFQTLTTPQELSAVQERELDILKISTLPSKQRDKAVKEHLKKFAWLKNSAYSGDFYNYKDLLGEIRKIKNSKQALSEYTVKLKEQKKEFNKYFDSLGDNEKEFVIVLLKSINFRSWRTERFYFNAFKLDDLFKHLGENLGLENYKDIFYFTPPEILNVLKQKKFADSQPIKERKIGYVMVSDKSSTRIYSGKATIKFKKRVNVKEKIESKFDKLSGQIAYTGKIFGKVRIIINKKDLTKVEDGEIIVTEMTTSDFVPALKKAKGIVTNEGGITCHAAIIARELKKPCIIGTKIATQILKNGDEVEVDANKGIVKIIKKF